MKAIDRVMAAYSKTHKLTDEQTVTVRKELSEFIDRLIRGRKLPLNHENENSPTPEIKTDLGGRHNEAE